MPAFMFVRLYFIPNLDKHMFFDLSLILYIDEAKASFSSVRLSRHARLSARDSRTHASLFLSARSANV